MNFIGESSKIAFTKYWLRIGALCCYNFLKKSKYCKSKIQIRIPKLFNNKVTKNYIYITRN